MLFQTLHSHFLKALFLSLALLLTAAAFPARAQSSDPDSPTPLTSNVIEGEGDGEAAVYYYRFAAGPGEVKVTVDAKTDYYSTPLEILLSDRDGKELQSIYVVATGAGKREVKWHKFLHQMPVILRVSLRQDKDVKSLTYKIKLEGEVGLASPKQPSSSQTSDSTDSVNAPTGQIQDPVEGQAPTEETAASSPQSEPAGAGQAQHPDVKQKTKEKAKAGAKKAANKLLDKLQF